MENFEYKDDKIERIQHSEGVITQRALRTGESTEFVGLGGLVWQYEYTLKDHLGNTRVTFADIDGDRKIDPNTEINQINHYYPFGLNMEGNWNGAAGSNKYQLTGKEWNDDFGLGMNDFGFRMYDPAIGRWNAIDPLGEKFIAHTPYNYVLNRPTIMIDPNGMEATFNATTGDLEHADGKDAANWVKGQQNANEKKEQEEKKKEDAQNSSRPSYETVKSNYPEYDLTPRSGDSYGKSKNSPKDNRQDTYTNYELFKEIGGTLGGSALNGDNVEDQYKYTCAIRTCHALNKSGWKIDKGVSGKNGKYLTSVLKLRDALGKADISISGKGGSLLPTDAQLLGAKGLIFFKIPYDDAGGHFALWDGKQLTGGGSHGLENFKEAVEIQIWKLK